MLETALTWFYDRKGKVTYSMQHRNGPGSYDCSSAVYYALIAAGLLPQMRIGNTDSLFGDLERHGWVKLTPRADGYIAAQRGDVFIWGARGASGGAAGHTGMFTSADDIIHCAYGYNGIHIDNHDYLWAINGYPAVTIYRYVGTPAPALPTDPHDQVVDVGSFIKFDKTYRVDDLAHVGGIWQIRTNALCKNNFTWEENGIPADPVYEVDSDGYASDDQFLDTGSLYIIPGKYQILDLGQTDGMWLALISMNGLNLWVDIESVTEVSANDGGTPVPGKRPAPTPTVPPVAPEPPVVPETPPVTEIPGIPEVPPKEEIPAQPPAPKPPINNPKEDIPMAFTKENQQELNIATQKVLDANEFTPVITDQVKTVAYFATDILAIVSGLVLTVLAILKVVDPIIALTLNAAITTALLGLKQTFRLSSKKQ